MEAVETGSGGVADAATVGELLDTATETIAAAGCDEPRADAEALVANGLGVSVEELSRDGAGEASPEVVAAIEAAVTRRADHEPLAYVELPEGARVHEVGTGSGAIALALISERPDLRITASDLSPEAVEAAHENAERLGLELEVSVAEGLPEGLEDVDLVIANLPYVTDETIYDRSPEIRREPRIAVTGACGEDGLGVIRGLIAETPSGWKLAMEHDTHHGPAMREMLGDATTMRDYMGGERVTVGVAP